MTQTILIPWGDDEDTFEDFMQSVTQLRCNRQGSFFGEDRAEQHRCDAACVLQSQV